MCLWSANVLNVLHVLPDNECHLYMPSKTDLVITYHAMLGIVQKYKC